MKMNNTKKKKKEKKLNNEIETPQLFDYVIVLLFRIFENTDKIKDNYQKQKIIIKSIIHTFKENNIFFNKSLSNNKINTIINLAHDKYVIWKTEKHKYQKTLNITHTNKNKYTKLSGGFYFKSLESKGDKPITGNDIAKLLDEIQQFMHNAKYTEEGRWLYEPDTLISLLRGDTNTFKSYINLRILPKYYQIYPPFLKFNAIKEAFANAKYEDYPDYLLAYTNYMKSKNEWEVSQGLAKPINYEDSPLAKFAKLSDEKIYKMQMFRRNLKPQNKLLLFGSTGQLSIY